MTLLVIDRDAHTTLGLALAELVELKADYIALESRLDDALCALRDVLANIHTIAAETATKATPATPADIVAATQQATIIEETTATERDAETELACTPSPAETAALAAASFFEPAVAETTAVPLLTETPEDTLVTAEEAVGPAPEAELPPIEAALQSNAVLIDGAQPIAIAATIVAMEDAAADRDPIVVSVATAEAARASAVEVATTTRRKRSAAPWMALTASFAAIACYLAYDGTLTSALLSGVELTEACGALAQHMRAECVKLAAALM